MAIKVSIIGAGSAEFSLRLIRDLCLTPGLAGSSVSLMDIDSERLEGVQEICRRYARDVGVDLTITSTTDRRASLDGADFVINTALAAGHHRLRAGWEVAQNHGYRFGGSLHVMHDEAYWINFYQYKLFESIAEDILELCPDAWLLQVANPVLALLSSMPHKYPDLKVVGLCHGYAGVYKLANTLGLDAAGLTWEMTGVNHHLWLTEAYSNGADVFPMIDEWIVKEAPAYWQHCRDSDYLGPKPIDIYQRFGVFPIGDTANPGGGAWGWWYHSDAAAEKRWQEDPATWFQGYFDNGAESLASIRALMQDPNRDVMTVYPPEVSGETMVSIIESIACDIPRIYMVNIPNDGNFVSGIPQEFAVEVPALVSKRGIQGIQTMGLPEPIISTILRDRVAPVTLELEAYQAGSRELMIQLLLSDPWTRSEEQAKTLWKGILNLPWHEEMRQHFQ